MSHSREMLLAVGYGAEICPGMVLFAASAAGAQNDPKKTTHPKRLLSVFIIVQFLMRLTMRMML
jgi:hypothetical protein